ncbi:fibril-forming collagen alpha chain-like [Penaeus japonicus]|uniref:fibril-forming collagen alpha chain-like n=1 Tax=Penaeus japonicus TaxID=27405 RepID=UPI001C716D72|nr:fibril-forming collagen alpha chain-like [Penaeus japonicus]
MRITTLMPLSRHWDTVHVLCYRHYKGITAVPTVAHPPLELKSKPNLRSPNTATTDPLSLFLVGGGPQAVPLDYEEILSKNGKRGNREGQRRAPTSMEMSSSLFDFSSLLSEDKENIFIIEEGGTGDATHALSLRRRRSEGLRRRLALQGKAAPETQPTPQPSKEAQRGPPEAFGPSRGRRHQRRNPRPQPSKEAQRGPPEASGPAGEGGTRDATHALSLRRRRSEGLRRRLALQGKAAHQRRNPRPLSLRRRRSEGLRRRLALQGKAAPETQPTPQPSKEAQRGPPEASGPAGEGGTRDATHALSLRRRRSEGLRRRLALQGKAAPETQPTPSAFEGGAARPPEASGPAGRRHQTHPRLSLRRRRSEGLPEA